MKFVPMLLRPRVHAILNRWKKGQKAFSNRIADICLLLAGLFIFYAIYRGTLVSLGRVAAFSDYVYFPASTPLSILLLFLFMMLILSSSVMSLGTFFLSQDNQLLLAAPIGRLRYFASKFLAVIINTAWMPIVFLVPFLLAFGVHYGGGILYYLSWPIVLLPYFVIPAAVAFLISLIIITVVPPSQTRILLAIVMLLMIAFLVHAGQLIGKGISTTGNIDQLLRILTMISFPDALWLPSHWAALSFNGILAGDLSFVIAPLGLLWATAILILSLSYASFSVMFSYAASRAGNRRRYIGPLIHANIGNRIKRLIPLPSVSLMMKDYRMLYRDLPQVIQLLLLVVIFLVYLYNLRVFGLLETLPAKERSSWLAFFFIANASMGAFVTTAATTRLVFPSLSLEGKSFWVLQTAPISPKNILNNKFWTWYIPIGLLASLTFTAGNIALGTGIPVILATFLVGWFLSGGLISLGLAIGAVFAHYDWEHTAQLIASFGSFVFMLLSILLITLNMIPLGIALFIRQPGMLGSGMSESSWYIVLIACGLFIFLVNTLVISLSFQLGERALLKQVRVN